jgi:twitching motility protein PilT
MPSTDFGVPHRSSLRRWEKTTAAYAEAQSARGRELIVTGCVSTIGIRRAIVEVAIRMGYDSENLSCLTAPSRLEHAMDLDKLLRFAVDQNASDVHIQSGASPMLRISGEMRRLDSESITSEAIRQLISEMAADTADDLLSEGVEAGLDFSYAIPDVARFRCSAYRQLGQLGMVIRIVRLQIPSFDELNLPKVVRDIALVRRGLILVTGTTGSGKSTTLAAMIDLINRTYRSKIITIEDPVEFVHEGKDSLISQFEVGHDTPSFERALRQSLRQDPDAILIGELRDTESLRIALHAADTGHQVFSTVHSSNAPQTIERIIAMFPPAEHHLLLAQLAGSIEAIISQRLLTTKQGGRRPAVEVLRGSPLAEYYILENKLNKLHEMMETGDSGMQSFDQHLLKLYEGKIISATESLRWASNSESLSMKMRMSARRRKDNS